MDVEENLVLGVKGISAGTGSSSLFSDASRNILIKMALGADCTEPISYFMIIISRQECGDRLCGLVVRVSAYRYRGPGFDPRRYQIF